MRRQPRPATRAACNRPMATGAGSQPQVYAPAPVAASPPVAAPPPAYVTSAPPDVSYFYNDLSPYGTWVSLEGYGWCWQPRDGGGLPRLAALLRWRPLGVHRRRMVLAVRLFVGLGAVSLWPLVSAPALRLGLDAGPSLGAGLGNLADGWRLLRLGAAAAACRIRCCGWAGASMVSVWGRASTLASASSAFAFVSFGDFCSHDIGHHCLPPARVTTIYRQTTIINNYVVNNNTIVNRGIPIERVAAASRVPVPRATVRDLPAGSRQSAQPDGRRWSIGRSSRRRHDRLTWWPRKSMRSHPVIQHSPIAPVSTGQPFTYHPQRIGSAATPRQPAMQAPKDLTWSSGAKPASSPQYQSAPRASESTHAAPSAATTTWSSGQRKSGASSATSNWSETSSAGGNKARTAEQSASAGRQASAEQRNPHVYYPKGYYRGRKTIPARHPTRAGQGRLLPLRTARSRTQRRTHSSGSSA